MTDAHSEGAISSAAVFNPTWLYTGTVYAGAVWALRRWGLAVPKRIAAFFYALVFVFMFQPLTQDFVNVPVDYLSTMPPWVYGVQNPKSLNGQMNDLPLQIIPWAHQVRESWKALRPPLWNDMSACGYPLLASAQSSALSPLRILGLPLSLGQALTFEAAMKILLALTFMFLWCRRRYSELASAASAVAFGFSTFLLTWLHFPIVTTACLVPAVFLIIDLLAEARTYGRFVAGAAVWAAMLFGGHPETVSHTFFLALLYAIWIAFVERRNVNPEIAADPQDSARNSSPRAHQPVRFFLALGGAMAVAALLAAPFLAPFAETVTKSKRFHELQRQEAVSSEVPYSDYPSAILLLQPHFWGKPPLGPGSPAHAESISGFAGYLGIVAWFSLLAHTIAKRRWRERETFFLLAAILVLGVILSWPGIRDAFHFVFRLAANARLRLLLVLLLAMLVAAAIDLLEKDRRSLLIGLAAASLLLLVVFETAPILGTSLANKALERTLQRETALLATIPSLFVLAAAVITLMLRRKNAQLFGTLAVLVAMIVELWSAGRYWNPVVPIEWATPQTPLLHAMAELKAKEKAPFRVVANGPTLFPNTSALYGLEDVRAHDPMANGRYIALLTKTIGYDAASYFAPWGQLDSRLLDFLNVKYVITSRGGELYGRYHLVYDGFDGRIFENTEVLPRFYAIRNVVALFDDDAFDKRIRVFDEWSHTALLDSLELEAPQMYDDFFKPRPPDAQMAEAKLIEATPTSYRLHVKAPRWSLIASSVPWWPGWKVERNGARVQPIRVNGAFLGFAVPEGELDVRVWYDPWTFRIGAIAALATVVALIAIGIWIRRTASDSRENAGASDTTGIAEQTS